MSDKQNEIISVEIASLNRGCTQLRVKMDPDAVYRYAEEYTHDDDGRPVTPLPPITVFRDGKGTLHLADEFHRTAAAEEAGHTHIQAEVRPGTEKDAILHAAGCNTKNGVSWTTKDKRNAVKTLLQRWPNLSNRKIASYCCCTHPFVGNIRNEVDPERDRRTQRNARSQRKARSLGLCMIIRCL